jgi:ABC-2 type transport system permease protein
MRVAWLIAFKDLRQRLRDRSALRIAIVAPLVMAVIFSQLLSAATDLHVTYVVANLDGGQLSHVLQDDVIGSLANAGVADVTTAATEEAARAEVENGDADAAFVIPTGFTTSIQAGQPTTLEVVGARDSTFGTEIAQSLGQRFGDGVVAVQLSVATVGALAGAPLDAAAQVRIAAAAAAARPPIELVDGGASPRQLSLATYFSAAMAILFLFLLAPLGMISLFTERRDGTLARILAGPVRPASVLLGKTLGSFVMATISMTVLIVATTQLIHADWGPAPGVTALIVAAVVSAIGVSTFVTSFARTQESASAASSAVAITLGILGGTFSPAGQGPEVLSTLAMATPHGWFLRGLADLHGSDSSLVDCLPSVAVLLAIGLVTGAIGLLRAERSLGVR